ncbi:MAG: SpoIID/LytB domain-containing protein [Patescibacteria group bacterium]
MHARLLRSALFFAAMLFGALVAAPTFAASLAALQVSVTGNGVIAMQPGEVKEISVTLQNIGTTTWKNDGAGYISLYTHEPKYRHSVFDPGTWLGPTQVKRIREATVASNGTATLAFQLHAPATEGTYTEVFYLASEGAAWVDGGKVALTISVKKSAPAETSTAQDPGTIEDEQLSASLVMKSANRIKATAGKAVLLTAGFKNTGVTAWTSYAMRTPDVGIASTSSASFTHPSWSGQQLAYAATTVAPGQTAYITFALTAPKTNGTHTARFQFAANDESVDDAYFEIPVEVTGGAAEVIDAEEVVEVDTTNFIDEPVMRVGVLIVDEETESKVVITSDESAFTLRDTNGTLLADVAEGDRVTAAYANGQYTFDVGNGSQVSAYGLRFVPTKANAVMKIANFDRTMTRGSANADNTFRNVLELRYNDTYERTWIINELPMEFYLRGLAETSNVSHLEFQKALITAARTYGFYHWSRASKHAKEGYHVDAYMDQVYKGYGQELRTPRLTESIEATRGQVVTYGGETAITAYFSRSDGSTRNWSDVWGGSVPWSKAVPVPCDVGKVMWGHGVGMSASGALCMANDGKLWDEILKYFYTGVDITQRWE